MTNIQRYNQIFKDTLSVSDDQLNESLKINEAVEWDSMGHVSLIAALEEEFDVMFDSEDILVIDSYQSGKKVLNKYGIEL